MALDFHVQDDARSPAPSVTLFVDEHWKLIEASDELKLHLFDRLRDYYGETEINEGDMDAFLGELTRLARAPSVSEALRGKVSELISFAREAKAQKKSLVVLPD